MTHYVRRFSLAPEPKPSEPLCSCRKRSPGALTLLPRQEEGSSEALEDLTGAPAAISRCSITAAPSCVRLCRHLAYPVPPPHPQPCAMRRGNARSCGRVAANADAVASRPNKSPPACLGSALQLNRSQPVTLGTALRGFGGGAQRYNGDQACADITAFTREPGCQRTMGIVADTLHRLSEHRHIKALLQPKWINKWKKGGRTADEMETRLPSGDLKSGQTTSRCTRPSMTASRLFFPFFPGMASTPSPLSRCGSSWAFRRSFARLRVNHTRGV